MTAATLVGSNSATAGTGSATTSGTMSLASLGVQVGDLVIVQCVVERNTSTPALAIAGGVSSFTTLLAVTSGTNLQTIVGYFFAQSGDLSATVAGTVAAARRIVAGVQVWRGAGTPTLVSNAAVSNAGGVTTLIHPSATPASADNVIMLALAGAATSSNFNTRTFTAAASFTKRIDAGATNTTSIDPYVGFSDQTLAGGSGTPTGTMTATASLGNFEYVAATILVPPGTVIVTGSASPTESVTVSTAGTVGAQAGAAPSMTAAAVATGAVGAVAGASSVLAVSAVAQGVTGASAGAASSVGVAVAAAGQVGVSKGSSPSFAVAAVAGGQVGKAGGAAAAIGVAVVAAGAVSAGRSAIPVLGVAVVAAGVVAMSSGSVVALGVEVIAAGQVGAPAASSAVVSGVVGRSRLAGVVGQRVRSSIGQSRVSGHV